MSYVINNLTDQKTGTFLDYYGPQSCGVVDNLGTGTEGDLVWLVGDGSNYCTLWTSQDLGATTSLITATAVSGLRCLGMAQDSAGILHAIVFSGGALSYTRGIPTRVSGHVTSVSWSTPFYLPDVPSSLGETSSVCALIVGRNGNGDERLLLSLVDGDNGNNYRAVVCQAVLNPSSASDFLAFDGAAGSWTPLATHIQASTDIPDGFAPYCFHARLEQYGSSGNCYVVVAPSGTYDRYDYGCAVYGQRFVASGATWSLDQVEDVLSVDSFESFLGLSYASNGNAYFVTSYRASDTVDGTLNFHRIGPTGALTKDFIPSLPYGDYFTEPQCALFVDSAERVVLFADGTGDANVNGDADPLVYVYENSAWSSGVTVRLPAYLGEIDIKTVSTRGSETTFGMMTAIWRDGYRQAMFGSVLLSETVSGVTLVSATAIAGAPSSSSTLSVDSTNNSAVGALAGAPVAGSVFSADLTNNSVVTASAGAPSSSSTLSVDSTNNSAVGALAGAPVAGSVFSADLTNDAVVTASAGAPISSTAMVTGIVAFGLGALAGAPTSASVLVPTQPVPIIVPPVQRTIARRLRCSTHGVITGVVGTGTNGLIWRRNGSNTPYSVFVSPTIITPSEIPGLSRVDSFLVSLVPGHTYEFFLSCCVIQSTSASEGDVVAVFSLRNLFGVWSDWSAISDSAVRHSIASKSTVSGLSSMDFADSRFGIKVIEPSNAIAFAIYGAASGLSIVPAKCVARVIQYVG